MILNEEKIKTNLNTKIIGRDLHFFTTVTSTFDVADEIEVSHGTVICALYQTNGRGRLGREWVSPKGGIYFSVILKPNENIANLQIYTNLCAIAVQRAIEKRIPCFIKWPNDIVSDNGKKLCGILTKAKFCDGRVSSINVGIGINANSSVSSDELPYASSVMDLTGEEIDESLLLSDVLFEIEKAIECEDIKKLIDEFSEKCITVGSRVKALSPDGKSFLGKCISIDIDGSAVIEKNDKTIVKINSGEMSVRGIYGESYV